MTSGNMEIGRGGSPWRVIGWGLAGGLLLLPFIAMQFTNEVNWTASDFVIAGVLIGGVGLLFELAVRRSRSWAYRAGVAGALAAGFMIIWANGAVGMIGDEDNAYNLLFIGVIGLALIGAVLTRFRAAGMAGAMAVAGAAQVAVALAGISQDFRGGVFSAGSALIWFLSAACFWAARHANKPAG